MSKNILVIGATSSIAQSCIKIWAKYEGSFFLVAKDKKKLEIMRDNLMSRGKKSVSIFASDLIEINNHEVFVEQAFKQLGEIDIALIAHGTLPKQEEIENDNKALVKEFMVNGLSTISILTTLCKKFEKQKFGSIGVISSVAGDRIRRSNYIYGTAKGMVSMFCEGLRMKLYKSNVFLTDIRPGFVETKMTKDLSMPPFLVSQPEHVAKNIVNGIKRKKNVIYTPFYWIAIMFIIRLIPNFIFKKLKF